MSSNPAIKVGTKIDFDIVSIELQIKYSLMWCENRKKTNKQTNTIWIFQTPRDSDKIRIFFLDSST